MFCNQSLVSSTEDSEVNPWKNKMAFHGMGLITLSIKAWEQSWQFSSTYLWLIKSLNISHLWADSVQSFLGCIFINIYAHCISFYSCTLAFHAFLNLFHTFFFNFWQLFLIITFYDFVIIFLYTFLDLFMIKPVHEKTSSMTFYYFFESFITLSFKFDYFFKNELVILMHCS